MPRKLLGYYQLTYLDGIGTKLEIPNHSDKYFDFYFFQTMLKTLSTLCMTANRFGYPTRAHVYTVKSITSQSPSQNP
jgi:hypothetical protein